MKCHFTKKNENGLVETIKLNVSYTPFRDANGKVKGILAFVQDVTDQVMAREKSELNKIALEKALAIAEKASQSKTAFLANMSHEIRTPMTAVLGFTELLRDPNISDFDKQDAIDRIDISGRALLRLIDDILDISKVESGKIEVHKQRFSPSEIAAEVMSLFKLLAEQKKIRLELSIDSSVPELVCSDPARVRQILTNLIGNAVKFTNKGVVSLYVSAREGRFLIFDVKDTGIGISARDQEKLFKPFAQADESITRKFGGTGLGLALSRRLADSLKGKLELRSSEEGKGSHFVATIEAAPFADKKVEAETSVISGPEVEEQVRNIRLSDVRILLAEDVADNQVLMRRYLEGAGAKVDIVSNGEEAVTKAQSRNYDLLLMDIQMPVMDGIQATKKLRKMGYDVPILALTAHAMKEEITRSFEAGCDAHLTKPISRTNLISTIQNFISGYHH